MLNIQFWNWPFLSCLYVILLLPFHYHDYMKLCSNFTIEQNFSFALLHLSSVQILTKYCLCSNLALKLTFSLAFPSALLPLASDSLETDFFSFFQNGIFFSLLLNERAVQKKWSKVLWRIQMSFLSSLTHTHFLSFGEEKRQFEAVLMDDAWKKEVEMLKYMQTVQLNFVTCLYN